jgi:hypothetical protein
VVGGDRVDFFISHAGVDRAWAEWVDGQLRAAGYSTELDVRDWAPGANFMLAMNDALARCDRVVALYSDAYFDRSRYTTSEWVASLLFTPDNRNRLIPLRLEDVRADVIPPLLKPILYRDIFGMHPDAAREALLQAVSAPGRDGTDQPYPGAEVTAPGFRATGIAAQIRKLPARNLSFSGREDLLATLRERLVSGDRAVVQALRGMGGVGKTQIAIEYAHRYAATYDLIWWVDSEQALLIGDQLATLGAAMGCLRAGAGTEVARMAVLGELRQRSGWLLIFDNVVQPADIAGWLPDIGTGHVLITTRSTGWHERVASPVEVDVFTRAESVALLCERVPWLSDADAQALASRLGDLPLAIIQAASYLTESRMPPDEYLDLLSTRAAQLLGHGTPESYPQSLAGSIKLIMERLTVRSPAAAALARICAFLAPEPIPLVIFPAAASQLPSPLAEAATDPITWRNVLAELNQAAIARIDHQTLSLHRVTQAVLRGHALSAADRDIAGTVLVTSKPPDADNPANWPAWALMLPHILVSDPAHSDRADLRDLACQAARYLLARADTQAAHDLASDLYQTWQHRLGPTNSQTLAAASHLSHALLNKGEFDQARQMDEETLGHRRQTLGEDHPRTLASASNLSSDLYALGDYQAARQLNEDTLARRRRVSGYDDPGALTTASNLANCMSALAEYQAARQLDEDTLARRRRILGDDHPDTLSSANNLASDLSSLGDDQAARQLDEDTLARRRRILGDDHLDTLSSANNLASRLSALGDHQAARQLDEDTLARRRRILGEDHPRTLTSAENLANDLFALGDHQAARQLREDTLARRRRILGDDHPDTVRSASDLAANLQALGKDG